MKTTFSKITVRGIIALALGAGLVSMGAAYADEHDMHHEHEVHKVSKPYRTEHWIYDDRHHHGHYYPTVGYTVGVLPAGFLALGYGSRRFFFQAGVWYAPVAGGFAVVRPPIGIIAPLLPPGYSTVWVAGVPYYYANDTYYASAPGGYTVVNPPAEGTYTEAPSAPPVAATPPLAPPAPTAQPAGGTWYYCVSANAYYPYVATCSEGWKPVPATAPPSH